MLNKEEIETAIKNGMVFNRKPTEPVLTKKLFELLKWAYYAGYCSAMESVEEGFAQLLNDYFEATDDNGQK